MGASLSRPVFLVAGTLYPGYGTFKALESRNVPDVKQWLAYWIVHAAIQGGEYMVGGAVSGIVPFYNLCKLAVLTWLVHPKYRGALYCYSHFVRPYLLRHQHDIDDGLKKASDVVAARTRAVSERTVQWLEQKKKETVAFVTEELKKAAVETIVSGNGHGSEAGSRSANVSNDKLPHPQPASDPRQSGGGGTTPVSISP